MSYNSLPTNYKDLKEPKKYVNVSELPEGEYRFRITQPAIGGWREYVDRKPIRYKMKPKHAKNPEEDLAIFWAFSVWDYSQKGLFVMEISQKSIINALEELAHNADWGDLTEYDFKLKKEKTGKMFQGHPVFAYAITPIPHKTISEEIRFMIESTPINLEALYVSKDPFKDLNAGKEASYDFDSVA